MKQFSALALAAALALPGTVALANEIKPLNGTLSTQDGFESEIFMEPDGYEAALAAGLIVIVAGIAYFVNDDDDGSTTGTNNTTGTN